MPPGSNHSIAKSVQSATIAVTFAEFSKTPARGSALSPETTSRILGLAVFIWLSTAFQEARAQNASPVEIDRAEVLVLGVYHMDNPGRDIFNTQADDVLSPRRQAEIADVIEVLRRFRPSKIAVEADFDDDRISERYAEYVAGKHELTRNEVEQLGYRLARELGHETVYPVDVDGEFPYPRLVKYAQATGRMTEFEELQAFGAETADEFSAYLASHTVLETLLYMNSDERIAQDVGAYFRLAEFGEPWDWAGADLVSDWFRRNMRIYSNVVGLVDDANERVLVIYGAGHLGWLQYAFRSNPTFRLRTIDEFPDPSNRP